MKANIHKIPETINIFPYVSLFLFPTKNNEIPKHRSIGIRDTNTKENAYILTTKISEAVQDRQYIWGRTTEITVNTIPIIPAFFKSCEDLFSRGWFFEEKINIKYTNTRKIPSIKSVMIKLIKKYPKVIVICFNLKFYCLIIIIQSLNIKNIIQTKENRHHNIY